MTQIIVLKDKRQFEIINETKDFYVVKNIK